MKISQCAELTGVTVRTIRYYHQLGLVPIPDDSPGYRDYSMSHVARILRVRWLAGAGLSLETIATIVDDDLGSGLDDLEATAATLQERIDELTDQQHRVRQLIALVKKGEKDPSMLPNVRDFYLAVCNRLDDPDARDLVLREMRLAQLMTQRGLVANPVELNELMVSLDEEAIDRAASFYSRFALLPKISKDEVQALTDELTADILAWAEDNELLTTQTLRLIPDWGFTSLGRAVISGFLHLLAPHRRQAQFLDSLVDLLMKEKP